MKKYLSGLLTGLILALSFTVLASELNIIPNPYPVLINGTNQNVDGYNINGYTYLKLSDFKKVGLIVKFNETDQQIEITSLNNQNNQLNNEINDQSIVSKILLDEAYKYSDWISTSDLKEKYNIHYTDTLDMNDITKSCKAKIENKNLKSIIEFAMPGYNYKENALYSVTIGKNTFFMWTKTVHDYYFRISELKEIGLIT